MKKIISALMVLGLFTVTVHAQDAASKAGISVRFSPTANVKINFKGMSELLLGTNDKINTDININAYSLDLFGRYTLKNDLTARFGIGMGKLNLNFNYFDDYSYYDETESEEGSLNQTRITVTPALERHFKNNKLEVLTGIGLPVCLIGKTNAAVKSVYTYTNGSTDNYEYTAESPGGFCIGLQSFAGFNFYITKGIALGTEISYGIGYMKSGGKTNISENDNGTVTTAATDELNINGLNILPLNGALVISVNF